MVKVTWTKLALKDLDSIHDFIAQDSEVYAKKFTEKLIARVQQLQEFPQSGRVVPEFDNTEIRELIEGNYRLVYKVSSMSVNIIRVHHASRKMK